MTKRGMKIREGKSLSVNQVVRLLERNENTESCQRYARVFEYDKHPRGRLQALRLASRLHRKGRV